MKPFQLSVVKPGNQKPKQPSTLAASRKLESSGVEAGRQPPEQVLAASETRYRRLFESAQDGILILDAGSGMVIDVNPFLVRMLGFSKAEICGKELWELGFFKDISDK